LSADIDIIVYSTRAATQAVTFDESDEFFGDSHIHSPRMIDLPSSSQVETSTSVVSRLNDRLMRSWHRAIQRWPVVLPVAREVLQLVLRANLMLFYFEGEFCEKYLTHVEHVLN
jgi:peroxin-10